MEKISVCMAVYNGEKFITEQIDSILCQIGTNDEIIISDDGCSDATIEIIRSYCDPRIKIVCNKGVHGYTKNFENALRYAKGDIIFLSDQDDVWMPNKVERVLDYLQRYDFVIHDCSVTDADLKVIHESFFEWMQVKSGFLSQMIRMRYLGCCMAFTRKVYERIMPFPPNAKYVEHDAWIASICEAFFRCGKLNEPLIFYRRHGLNTSDGGNGKGYPLWNKLCRRVYRLYYILNRAKTKHE